MSVAARMVLVFLLAPCIAIAAPEMPGREWVAAQSPAASLRVPGTSTTFRWDTPLEKLTEADDGRRIRVGVVRDAPKSFAEPAWQAVSGGHVTRFDLVSPGADGLRARLDLAAAGLLEMRVSGRSGRVETMTVPAGAREAWGPWTEGDVQSVEVFARTRPAPGTLRPGAVVHFDRPLDAKAAGSCTIDTPCGTGDPALDAAIAERKRGMARITFVEDGRSYLCTGTLLNTEKFPVPYFLTANHCVGRAAVAASITSFWFYEATDCGSGVVNPDYRQVAGGMAIEFADPNTDQTLLVMNTVPPSGVVFSGWNAARLRDGEEVLSLSHPAGDVSKLAQAVVSGAYRFTDWEQSAWLTRYTRGIVQGGSSGSGLFTMGGGALQLRAVLSATTANADGGMSCSNPDQLGVYNRFDIFIAQVARRLQANPVPVNDDHGDRPAEATPVTLGAGETAVAGRIDYEGDVDVFRLSVASPGTLILRASGGMDTVGVLLDAEGERITSNDDAQADSLDFGITRRVEAGTYYVAVTRWESAGTGPYLLTAALADVSDNYTDLWWDPEESGWGINLNHQGGILFATLFTYGTDGRPDWFVMSRGERQPDGGFLGDLHRTSGPPFNAQSWFSIGYSLVGTMRVAFSANDAATLEYTADGVAVSKRMQRMRFSTSTTCSWSAFDRSYARNYQDVWWNAAEPGWGINFAHQGDILVGTLFTYALDGRGLWLIMSRGERVPGTNRYEGALHRATGPPFYAKPWSPIALTQVGTMAVEFTDGNAGTLSYSVDGVAVAKPIARLAFDTPATQCESDD